MSFLTRYRRQVKEARRYLRLPTFETPVTKRSGVSRRSLALGISAFLAAASLPPPDRAQAGVWLRVAQAAANVAVPLLQPKRNNADGTANYNGNSGSGFAGFPTDVQNLITGRSGVVIPSTPHALYHGRVYSAVASDGVGIEAAFMPAFQLTSDPVTDGRISGDKMLLFENYVAGLDGLDLNGKVFVGVEGNVYAIPSPSPGLVQTWEGTRLIGGHIAQIVGAAFNEKDEFHVYAWSSPPDGMTGMTTRVLGPFLFTKKSAADVTVTINPGGTQNSTDPKNTVFTELAPALNFYASGNGKSLWDGGKTVHVDVKFPDNYVLDFASTTATAFTDNSVAVAARLGRWQHVAGSNCKIANGGYANMDCMFGAVDWTGWSIDIANANVWTPKAISTPPRRLGVLTKCDIYSSIGAGETPGGFGVGSKTLRSSKVFGSGTTPVAMLACRFRESNPGDLYVPTMVGCTVYNMPNDVADIPSGNGLTGTGNIVPLPYLNSSNSYRYITGYDVSTPAAALTMSYVDPTGQNRQGGFGIRGSALNPVPRNLVGLVYTGTGVGSYDVTGSHGNYVPGEGPRTLTLRVDGNVVATFAYGQNGIYTMGDLLAAIRTFGNGWVANPGVRGSNGALQLWTESDLATSVTFSGSVSGSTLTVSNVPTGTLTAGMVLFSVDGTELTTLGKLLTGSASGTGTWQLGTGTSTQTVVTSATSFGAASYGANVISGGQYLNLFCRGGTISVQAGVYYGTTAGPITGMVVRKVSGSVASGRLTLSADASANPPILGQTVFSGTSGAVLGQITSATGSGAVGSQYGLTGPVANSDTQFYVAWAISHYDARTFLISVGGVGVKSWAAKPTPGTRDNDNIYYVDDYKTEGVINGIAKGTQLYGLASAITNFGNGWSATALNQDGSLMKGARFRMAEIYALVGGTILGVVNSSKYAQYSVQLGTGANQSNSAVSSLDAHVDNTQSGTGSIDNAICSNNRTTMSLVQCPIIGTSQTPAPSGDGSTWTLKANCAFINNCAQNTNDVVNVKELLSSIQDKSAHFLVAHNSLPGLKLVIRGGIRPLTNNTSGLLLDTNSRIVSNVFNALSFSTWGLNAQSQYAEIDGLAPNMSAQVRRNAVNALYSGDGSFNIETTTSPLFSGNKYINGTLGGSATGANTVLTNRDSADYPFLVKGYIIDGTQTDELLFPVAATPFQIANFIPAASGPLRTAAYLKKADVVIDAWGRYRAANDMPGAASLLAA